MRIESIVPVAKFVLATANLKCGIVLNIPWEILNSTQIPNHIAILQTRAIRHRRSKSRIINLLLNPSSERNITPLLPLDPCLLR